MDPSGKSRPKIVETQARFESFGMWQRATALCYEASARGAGVRTLLRSSRSLSSWEGVVVREN